MTSINIPLYEKLTGQEVGDNTQLACQINAAWEIIVACLGRNPCKSTVEYNDDGTPKEETRKDICRTYTVNTKDIIGEGCTCTVGSITTLITCFHNICEIKTIGGRPFKGAYRATGPDKNILKIDGISKYCSCEDLKFGCVDIELVAGYDSIPLDLLTALTYAVAGQQALECGLPIKSEKAGDKTITFCCEILDENGQLPQFNAIIDKYKKSGFIYCL